MTTYYTTLNSGLKFIDNFVTDSEWTPCVDNKDGEFTLTTQKIDNVDTFSLKFGGNSVI